MKKDWDCLLYLLLNVLTGICGCREVLSEELLSEEVLRVP